MLWEQVGADGEWRHSLHRSIARGFSTCLPRGITSSITHTFSGMVFVEDSAFLKLIELKSLDWGTSAGKISAELMFCSRSLSHRFLWYCPLPILASIRFMPFIVVFHLNWWFFCIPFSDLVMKPSDPFIHLWGSFYIPGSPTFHSTEAKVFTSRSWDSLFNMLCFL